MPAAARPRSRSCCSPGGLGDPLPRGAQHQPSAGPAEHPPPAPRCQANAAEDAEDAGGPCAWAASAAWRAARPSPLHGVRAAAGTLPASTGRAAAPAWPGTDPLLHPPREPRDRTQVGEGAGASRGRWREGGLKGRGPCTACVCGQPCPGDGGGPVGEGGRAALRTLEPHPAVRGGSRASSQPPGKTFPPCLGAGAAEGASPSAGGTSCGESWDEPALGGGCRWCSGPPAADPQRPSRPLSVGRGRA